MLTKEKTWKLIFNTNSQLSQNRTEKQIISFKTTVNWVFNVIWCYSVIFWLKNWRFSRNICNGFIVSFPFMYDIEKYPNMFKKSWGVSARFLKYVWPFFHILYEKINWSAWLNRKINFSYFPAFCFFSDKLLIILTLLRDRR